MRRLVDRLGIPGCVRIPFRRMPSSLIQSLRLLVGLAACLGLGVAVAAPFQPADDSVVLERLPFRASDPVQRELRLLREQLAENPRNEEVALRAARSYYRLALAEGDPRYVGYAQAALGHWWNEKEPPVRLLVMRATLRQYLHDFEGALEDLGQALEREPGNGSARFQRAIIHIVRADYPKARADCENSQGLVADVMADACVATVDSFTGKAREAYERLRETLARHPAATPTQRLWVLSRIAEVAYRLGRAEEADRYFREALALGIEDNYLLATYAEFLLDEQRYKDAVTLLEGRERSDVLLVRLALAEKALGLPEAREHEQIIRARFDAARLRGDKLHLQDEARFTLYFLERPREAIALARENYQTQREPSDARMLMEAALAARDPGAAKPALDWFYSSGHEDIYIRRVAEALRRLPP